MKCLNKECREEIRGWRWGWTREETGDVKGVNSEDSRREHRGRIEMWKEVA